jgi:phosphoglycerate dehydrogenase-like enzyme
LVVEKDLLETLKQGRIRGAALDVFNIEPLPANSEWRTTPWGKDGRSNVLLTPHTGYVEDSAIETFYKVQADILTRRNKGEDLQEWLLTRS